MRQERSLYDIIAVIILLLSEFLLFIFCNIDSNEIFGVKSNDFDTSSIQTLCIVCYYC